MNADAAMDELRGGYGVQCKQLLVSYTILLSTYAALPALATRKPTCILF